MENLKEILISQMQKYQESGTLIVLKGFKYNEIEDIEAIDMDKLLKNRFSHFTSFISSSRSYMTYEEYLALSSMALSQYKEVVIIQNNIYFNYFPLNSIVEEDNLKGLLIHYDEELTGEKNEIGDISELTSIYSNIKKIGNQIYVTYNDMVIDEKELHIKAYDIKNEKIYEEIRDTNNCYEISDEDDYINMIEAIINSNQQVIYILEKETSFNKIVCEEKLSLIKLLKSNLEVRCGRVKSESKLFSVRNEFTQLLEKYWGHPGFREVQIYDLDSLRNKKVLVKKISQAKIITDIVDETEKCINKKDYRDIFVTASTGAGKSVMFQIPAIHLAEKYELFTIVISPLIGLMKDQVNNLEKHECKYARTINSDITPIEKQEIINDIADYKCHILYLSPESLLSKSDLEQIIGERTLGLLVIDEAHIVTTWGKQFRPDYWYLGDHLNKIKKSQIKNKGMGFVIATFTATAIYGGIENMYEETLQSLKMLDPITYLGYVRRSDININIEKVVTKTGRTEYEDDKFKYLLTSIDEALMFNKKMLIYFPTVALIERFFATCMFNELNDYVTKYHGQLSAYEKEENYNKFLKNESPIMLATKAFGMGIDIDDIEVVCHFAPTGNVCDYVQEIGRAARRPELDGEASYKYMSNDFKHINKLHGLSQIKKYQLVEVIKKVYELHNDNIKSGKQNGVFTKKRNQMLVDAENFSHIFENPFFNEDDGINKVKTAMLLIQKDFENRFSYSPFTVRPIPLFEIGFFKIPKTVQNHIIKKYGNVLREVEGTLNVCNLNLKKVWEKGFESRYSFPKFKFLVYTRSEDLKLFFLKDISPALQVEITYQNCYVQKKEEYFRAIKNIVNKAIREERFYSINGTGGLAEQLMRELKINKYRAQSIMQTLISSMSVYQRDYKRSTQGHILKINELKSSETKYKFNTATTGFFRWLEVNVDKIDKNCSEGMLYLLDQTGKKGFKETLMVLGILETFDLLQFKALGGRNSQIYIYVNQTKTMKEIVDKPGIYNNRLLDLISERHEVSVKMLTYLFESDFDNDTIWDKIENYFLGIIPDEVIEAYEKKTNKTLKLDC